MLFVFGCPKRHITTTITAVAATNNVTGAASAWSCTGKRGGGAAMGEQWLARLGLWRLARPRWPMRVSGGESGAAATASPAAEQEYD